MDPLPNLRTRDFGSSDVFHQVVDGHCTTPAEPRLDVLQGHADVATQASLGDIADGDGQQIFGTDRYLGHIGNLIFARECLLEDLVHRLHQPGMCDPRAIKTLIGLTLFVVSQALHRARVGIDIVLARNDCRHPTHCMGTTTVAGSHQQLGG